MEEAVLELVELPLGVVLALPKCCCSRFLACWAYFGFPVMRVFKYPVSISFWSIIAIDSSRVLEYAPQAHNVKASTVKSGVVSFMFVV